MKNNSNIVSQLFGVIVFTIGILNIFLVDYRPGIIYILLSAIYFIPAQSITKNETRLKILKIFKILFGIIIIWFTLGVSDLGDMYL